MYELPAMNPIKNSLSVVLLVISDEIYLIIKTKTNLTFNYQNKFSIYKKTNLNLCLTNYTPS